MKTVSDKKIQTHVLSASQKSNCANQKSFSSYVSVANTGFSYLSNNPTLSLFERSCIGFDQLLSLISFNKDLEGISVLRLISKTCYLLASFHKFLSEKAIICFDYASLYPTIIETIVEKFNFFKKENIQPFINVQMYELFAILPLFNSLLVHRPKIALIISEMGHLKRFEKLLSGEKKANLIDKILRLSFNFVIHARNCAEVVSRLNFIAKSIGKLNKISFEGIGHRNFPNLQSFTSNIFCQTSTLFFKSISWSTTVNFPRSKNDSGNFPNLTNLVIGDICQKSCLRVNGSFPQLTRLSINSCDRSEVTIHVELPKIKDFIIKNSDNSMIAFPSSLDNLENFLAGDIRSSQFWLNELPNLRICTIDSITSSTLRLPKELLKLEKLTFGKIGDGNDFVLPSLCKKLENFSVREWANLGNPSNDAICNQCANLLNEMLIYQEEKDKKIFL